MATAWSAPGWVKTGGKMAGGSLISGADRCSPGT
jgi:hypothetical protein